MKVKNVEPGVKFKTKSGQVFEVLKFEGQSESSKSDLWRCADNRGSEAVFTDWAILDKEEVIDTCTSNNVE